MKKIMFCGGGSAGHVIPNLALIEELNSTYFITYMGTDGIEKGICNKNKIPFYAFEAVKLRRGKIFCNLSIPFKLVKSYKQAKQILKATKPDLLFCKGGYVSIPAAYAAHRLHIPVLTHESDMSAGIANKVIAPVCKQVLTAFPTTAQQFKRATFVGTPVRKSLFSRNRYEAKKAYGLDMRPTILVFGGGSGSQAINQNLQKALPALCQEYNVLHICGKGNLTEDTFYGYKQVEFINDMGLAYACADYAVARCGANSANELVALKIPTLFIPLANQQSRGDQIENAQYFYKQGLCHVLQEKDLTPESLKKAIYRLIADRTLVHHLEESTTAVANQSIINIIETLLPPSPTIPS